MALMSEKKQVDCTAYQLFCPACNTYHRLIKQYDNAPECDTRQLWSWDGDLASPTITPERIYQHNETVRGVSRNVVTCQFSVVSGQLVYGECENAFSGKVVDMVEVPEWNT